MIDLIVKELEGQNEILLKFILDFVRAMKREWN